MKSYWPGIGINSIIGILIYTYVMFGVTGEWPVLPEQAGPFLAAIFLTNLTGWGLWWTARRLRGRFSGSALVLRYWLTGVLLNILMAWAIWGIPLIGYLYFRYNPEEWDFVKHQWQEGAIRLMVILFIGSFVYAIIDIAIYSYRQYTEGRIHQTRLIRQQLSLEYDLLRSQLSPHYLFNNLNTIHSLIRKDPELAETFIRKLAQSFQYILDTHHRKLISIQAELDFVNGYVFLLKVRFGDSLVLEIQLPDSHMQMPIPPLTLQLLVENAVKHNVITPDSPLHIHIDLDQHGMLRIRNNKTSTPAFTESFGIGLSNIRKRYAYFSDESVLVSDDQAFIVRLPVISSETFSDVPASSI